jgi:hypothetical protein
MPFGDGTGPFGQGSRTGRGAGTCASLPVIGSRNRGGRPAGRVRGGRGRRNCFQGRDFAGWPGAVGQPDKASSEEDLGALRAQASYFERTLENIRKRVEGREANAKPE